MTERKSNVSEQIAGWVRYLILILAGVALISEIGGTQSNRVYAATPVAAAPSYLSFTAKANGTSRFYITDTNKSVICVYTLDNDKLRLVSVRRFDADSKIMDGTIAVPKPLEGLALTHDQAEEYARRCRPVLDNEAKKFGHQSIGEE